MSIPAHDLQFSPEEYLELEGRSNVRHEYVNGRIFAMSGATAAHDAIVVNLTVLLGQQLHGSGCRLSSSDMKVRIKSTGNFYYPDLMVSCELFAPKATFKEHPCFIFEVLSPSTRDIDLREKVQAYQSIPTLNEYVIVYQDELKIEVYSCLSENRWKVTVYGGSDSFVLKLPSDHALKLSLDDIYDGVIEIKD